MNRKKAIQTMILGAGSIGIFCYCEFNISIPSILKKSDEDLVSLLSEAILPSKNNEFPTPESRIQFILNQLGGGLTSQEFGSYNRGLKRFKGLIERTFLKTYQDLDSDIQNFTIQRALYDNGDLGYFMQKNRQWSLRHFTTSERYMTEFLNYEFIPTRHLGCVAL